MDKDVRLIDRSISAHHLEGHLNRVLDLIDRMRLVQQRGRPRPRPPWWNDHMRHSVWLLQAPFFTENCRRHRTSFAHWVLETALADAIAAYPRLAEGFDLPPAQRALIRDAETALMAMRTMLSPGQLSRRLYSSVIPERSQLQQEIPEVYTPVLKSDHELWLEDEVDRVCYQYVSNEVPKAVALDLTKRLQRRSKKLARRRVRENRRRLQTKVTPERRELAIAMIEDWRQIVQTWSLAEMAVRRAIEFLRGTVIVVPQLDPDQLRLVRTAVEQTLAQCQRGLGGGIVQQSRNDGRYVLRQIGTIWDLSFDGVRTPLADCVGLSYLRFLLGRPGKFMSYAEVAADALPANMPVENGVNELATSKKTLAVYWQALDELRDRQEEATRNDDVGALDEIARQRELLSNELKRATFAGRIPVASQQYKRQRQKVNKALDRVYAQLGDDHPAARYFRQAIEREGGLCYRSPGGIVWELW